MAAAAGAGPVHGPLPELGHVGTNAAAGVATRAGEGGSCDRKLNLVLFLLFVKDLLSGIALRSSV